MWKNTADRDSIMLTGQNFTSDNYVDNKVQFVSCDSYSDEVGGSDSSCI